MDTLGDYHTELSQIEKNKCHMVSLYMESKKKRKIQMNVFTKWKETQRLGRQTYGYQRGNVVGVKGIHPECGINIYTLPYIKCIINKDLL